MKIPVMQGVIDRRILVNFRINPDVLARVLPHPFRPKLVRGKGIAGICLIRLQNLRPRFAPLPWGISSENAAHRMAVEWDEAGGVKEGVYIPRRDSSSRLNAILGGRLFPGFHHHARFQVEEGDGHYRVVMDSDDEATHVAVTGRVATDLPPGSVFRTLAEASAFFQAGSLGYSATRTPGRYDGLELRTINWQVRPLAVEHVASSFFDDRNLFPAGSVEFDCALLMQQIEHQWHAQPSLFGAVARAELAGASG